MREISCTRDPENKPGAAIPAYPWQGHGNNTHTHLLQHKFPHFPLDTECSRAGLRAHPTARGHTAKALTGLGCELQHAASSPVGSAAPELPRASSRVGSAAPCFTPCLSSAQAAAGCAGEECHCCQLLPAAAQRGQASPRGSPELQPRSSAGGDAPVNEG